MSAAQYLRLVWHTTNFIFEPADAIERIPRYAPIILTMWHGQHFLTPFVKPPQLRTKVLISRHRDGEINAIAAERLGTETSRCSGTHGTDVSRDEATLELARKAVEEALNAAASRACELADRSRGGLHRG